MQRHKIELSDLDGYDWDYFAKYGDEVIAELAEAFVASITNVMPDIEPLTAQRLASEWAETRGATLLRLDGDENLVRLTRERVNELVSRTIERGDSLQTLQKSLREDFAFSRERSRLVARTETAKAHGQGSKGAAIQQGRNEKRWMTQGDELVRPEHVANGAQGWIKINDIFSSGEDTIGSFNCRCTVIYRTAEPEERIVAEVRCPTCHKRLPVNNVPKGTEVYCKRCNQTFEV